MMSPGKNLVSKTMKSVKPGQHLNRAPGPRVLVVDPGQTWVGGAAYEPVFDAQSLVDRLEQTVPTVVLARSLSEYNLNEWDCVVVAGATVNLHESREEGENRSIQPKVRHVWSQPFPKTVSVINFVSPGDLRVLDAFPSDSDGSAHFPQVAIIRDPRTTGSHLRQVDGLPERLSALVSRELVPEARNLNEHLSFRRWENLDAEPASGEVLALTPFLMGPDDVVLAGSYPRNETASTWLLPDVLPDLYPWVIEALRQWHYLYPDRFPVVPDWHDDGQWQSSAEAKIRDQQTALREQFQSQFEQFKGELDALDVKAAQARESAAGFERALLTDDGESLSQAVGCAFALLGFHVVDMDLHWPDRDRREDLRICDEDDRDWVAIVEVKGAKHGAKETEVQNFGRWAERFILDEHRPPDARWFVTNHQRGLDPSAREEPFANKPAVIETFAKVNGTVIDSRALFDLVRLVEDQPELASRARAVLKARPPILVRVAAADLDHDAAPQRE